MTKGRRATNSRWTDEMHETAVALSPTHTLAQLADIIGERFGHAVSEQALRDYLKRRKLPYRRTNKTTVMVHDKGFGPPVPPRPPAPRYSSLTAYLCGDPPLGRRAIDQRDQANG